MKNLNTSVLGVPRIGKNRELKKALEAYWKGNLSEIELMTVGQSIRKENWEFLKTKGVTSIPSNDFSFYDQVLDMSCLLGNIPKRFNFSGDNVDMPTYFSVARGNTSDSNNDQFASEMTKWFDTNYHYIVPEFDETTTFRLSSQKCFEEYKEAKALGIETRPVLIGPFTYLNVGKLSGNLTNKYDLLDALLVVYTDILTKFESLGVTDIQMDEPSAILDLTTEEKQCLKKAYESLAGTTTIKLHFTTYFGELRDNQEVVYALPVSSIQLDATRSDIQLALTNFPVDKTCVIGAINGRNIWINNFDQTLSVLKRAIAQLGEDRVALSTSCSLLHSPITLENETKLDGDIKQWLSFANQKVEELCALALLAVGEDHDALAKNQRAIQARNTSALIHDQAVKQRLASVKPEDFSRDSSFDERQKKQQDRFDFPLFPTTTIGSFPQTAEVRQARAGYKKGTLSADEYRTFLQDQVKACVSFQESIGIDVLVHGEFERNDMVEYFGEQLNGFAFTQFGWVQSYGSRCVKPPIIYGDVSRPKPMTVEWSTYAQSLTKQFMKGMLTGPVTILQWSFVRDDQPRKDTTMQIALAIRDEVVDLEKAGISVIQIDEAALREGLPIRQADWQEYLTWSVDAFRLSTAGVSDNTQIHTHMCYSEFNDIIEAIARMDADVISIETSRSNMELLDAFVTFNYPNEVGPGVYDIHSPRVPNQENMTALIKKAADLLPIRNLWVNPDCGLKTRGWPEVKAALSHMVSSAKELREAFKEVSVN